MNRIDNRRAGAWTRAATVIVPATLLVLGTTGVVAKPTLGLEAARRQRAEAEERTRAFEVERDRMAQFERLGGLSRIATATRAVEALVPRALSALDLQNIVLLVARRDHVDLQTVEIGEPLETTFPGIDDRIVAVGVAVRGSATFQDLVRFTDDIRGLGLAASIVECRISRARPGDKQLELQLTLSFHHRDEPMSAANETAAGGS